jgi:hypothetical protein
MDPDLQQTTTPQVLVPHPDLVRDGHDAADEVLQSLSEHDQA